MTTINDPTDVTLRDGRRVTIRPIRRADAKRTSDFIDSLSTTSKHTLFLGGVAHLSDSELRRLCDPEDPRDMAFVATVDDGRGVREVGMCRYAGADADAGAEISVAVADDYQHQGLGRMLLQRLIGYAHAHGIARLYSMDLRSNGAMRQLARDVGFSEHPDPDDIHQVIYSLRP
jgi:GNAT superfamily N-acetyltransferase